MWFVVSEDRINKMVKLFLSLEWRENIGKRKGVKFILPGFMEEMYVNLNRVYNIKNDRKICIKNFEFFISDNVKKDKNRVKKRKDYKVLRGKIKRIV